MAADLAAGVDLLSARSYRRDGVHGRLVHDLGRRIVSGEFAPGELLPTETALVTQLGSGRSAVREAVKVLTAKGLVRTRTKTGTVVLPEATWNLLDPDVLAWRYQASPTGKQLDDLAGLRVALEPEAARLAARTRSRAATAPITAAYQRMAGTVADPDTFIGHDLAFHRAIVDAGGNLLMAQLSDLLHTALTAARQVHTRNVRRNKRTLAAHQAVLDAITSHDAEAAGTLMRKLVTGARRDIRREQHQKTR
ncbi:MAG TPA: FadR/GntR family transcriptional regulator [Streptosporangiaceae bacterium]|nr:FadR/GntR family transcriptional regulator [Streptosporangiaceae bacterium]